MKRFEKEVVNLIYAHGKAKKCDLIRNINKAIKESKVMRKGKNEWVSKVTGIPKSTVCTWFSNAKCRSKNKIPLLAMCQIAVALNISVWIFFETDCVDDKTEEVSIDRKSKLYWGLRRNEAKRIWNHSYGQYGAWEIQSKAVQREFVDKLYLEKLEEEKGSQS